jgi:hypothetical protein
MYKRSNQKDITNSVWWVMPVIPTVEMLRQKDLKFEVSLGNTERT